MHISLLMLYKEYIMFLQADYIFVYTAENLNCELNHGFQ